MPMTPLDIRKKTFRRVRFNGLDSNEVKAFLDQVARDFEELWKERVLLNEKVNELNARLDGFLRTENAFKDAFVSAQQACKEIRESAEREARAILERAQTEAEKLRLQAEEQITSRTRDIADIRLKKLALLNELRTMLTNFGKLIEHWEAQEVDKARTGSNNRAG